jgi:hypothetical protein
MLTVASSNHFVKEAAWAEFKTTPAAIALEYVRRGWNPLPLPYESKVPVGDEWQHRVIRDVDVPKYFNGGPQNIGVRWARAAADSPTSTSTARKRWQ